MDGEIVLDRRQSEEPDASEVCGRTLAEMREKQGGKCYYTGEELTLENVSLDHIIPLCDGGEHSISNVSLCTKEVNRVKGQMSEAEFVKLCRRVVRTFDGSSL